MPRVSSEVGSVHSHHQTFAARRPAAGEDKPPSTGFAALLDDTGETPSPTPPASHDHVEGKQSNSTAASTPDPQPDHRAQRRQDSSDGGDADGNVQQPSADAAGDGTGAKVATPPAATETALVAAKEAALTATAPAVQPDAADKGGDDATPASTEANAAAALAAAINAPAPPQPVANAVTPPAAVVAAVSDASAVAPRQATTEPVPGAAAGVPAAMMEAGDTVLNALAQSAGDAIAEKGGAGRKATTTTSGPDGARTRSAKAATSVGTITSSTTTEATGDSPAAVRPESQTAAQTGSNASGKGETIPPNAGRPSAPEEPPRQEATRLQVEAQVLGAADKPATEATQLTSLQSQIDHSTGNLLPAAAPPAAPGAAAAVVPIAGLAVEIAARVQAGSNRFEIRLDPPELGRIDVRLDFDRDGQVTSRVTVDKAETLNLLQRGASDLERALQQVGLKTSDGGLQFTLRDQSFGGQNPGQSDRSLPEAARLVIPDPEMTPVEALPGGYGRSLGLGTGIDIRV